VFTPEPGIVYIPASRDQVVLLVEGINQPQVSIPGKPPQSVSGHLVGLRDAGGRFSVLIGLHLPRSGENVVYAHPRREVGLHEFGALQDEGLAFLESMGFMLDNLNFRNLGTEQQDAVLRRVPLFSPRSAPASPQAESERELGRLGRLLANL
jgi:hypothetical protein